LVPKRRKMMDIQCPKCGEPWEIDTLHDYAAENDTTFTKLYRVFRTRGCGEAFAEWRITCIPDKDAEARTMLAEVLGDDVDGYAATLEDFGLL
jgi:hypothetical protein